MNNDKPRRNWHQALLAALEASKVSADDLRVRASAKLGEVPVWLTDALTGEREPAAPNYLVMSSLTSVPVPVLAGVVDPAASAGVALRAGTLADPSTDTAFARRRGVELIEAARLVSSWLGADALARVELADRLRTARSRVDFAPKAGRQSAEQVRAVLGRLGLIDRDGPIDDLAGLVEMLGIPVELSKQLPEGVHGITVHDQSLGAWDAAIIIRVDDYWVRQRYTLAHELCHVLYKDSGMVFVNDDQTESSQVDSERRAEHFARHFLAPTRQAKKVWRTHQTGGIEKALCEFMVKFGISRLAAVNTVRSLDLITDQQAASLRGSNVGRMMGDSGLSAVWEELVASQNDPSASVWLVEAALNLYEQGLVPVKTVASILGRPEPEVRDELTAQGWNLDVPSEASQSHTVQLPDAPL